MRPSRCCAAGWLAGLSLALLGPAGARAQQQYPTPVLTSLSPPGARAGTTVEVTVRGNHLEGVDALHFSQPGLTATRLPDPPNPNPKKPRPPAPLRFKVSVPANTSASVLDVRVSGTWGISNPRAFAVSHLAEVQEKEPNNDVPQAQKVGLETVINGVIGAGTDVDYFAFTGKKGQRVMIHCAGSSIDSRLDPLVRVFDVAGRELADGRHYRGREAVLDCALPADGEYLVRLCHFTHIGGGPDYYYRLSLTQAPWIDAAYPPVVQAGKATAVTLFGRNLPGRAVDPLSEWVETAVVQVTPPGAVLSEKRLTFRGTALPRCGALDGFEYRLKGEHGVSNPILLACTEAPVVLDNGDNDTPGKAQAIPALCEVCGRIEKKHDRDRYVFAAKKGDVLIIEGYADRLRSPLDLYFKVRLLGGKQTRSLGEFDDHPDIPARLGQLFTHSKDPRARLVIPADGRYELTVSSRAASVSAGPRQVYWVSLRKEQPDFRLLVVGNNDGDVGGCTVRQGASQDLQVVCFRRDGFKGEVALSIEGLPAGVTCPPQMLGPTQRETALVLTATPGAAKWTGPIRVKGKAVIGGKEVVREARASCIVWPAPNNQPAVSRLARSLWLAVRKKGPYSLTPAVTELSVPVGGSLSVKLRINRQSPAFKANVQVVRRSAPVRANGQVIGVPNVNIPNNKGEADIKIQVPRDTVPGVSNLVFQGTGQFPFQKGPRDKKRNIRAVMVSAPVRLTIYNSVAEVSTDRPAVTLRPGGQAVLTVKVKRQHGYKGPFTVQLVLPRGFGGVSAAPLTIPAGASEGRLVLRAPANAKPASSPSIVVRATAKVDKVTLTQDSRVAVTIAK